MNPQEQTLWNRIKAFQIDEEGVRISFSDRLARDNGWTKQYAVRVVEEYKKFIFLCCITQTGVTPSDPVDQAWHLHLTYTKSYWIQLCRNTLQKELHHNPTKGGEREAKKFDDYYTETHKIYKEQFGEEAPKDIWQDNRTRFTDIRFQRINLKQYWVLQKPSYKLRRSIVVSGFALFALLFIQATFDVSSYVFIAFLVVLAIVVYRQRRKGDDSSGCSGVGCNSTTSHSNHNGDGGCSSGCSGCSSSGCSGCGGGGD